MDRWIERSSTRCHESLVNCGSDCDNEANQILGTRLSLRLSLIGHSIVVMIFLSFIGAVFYHRATKMALLSMTKAVNIQGKTLVEREATQYLNCMDDTSPDHPFASAFKRVDTSMPLISGPDEPCHKECLAEDCKSYLKHYHMVGTTCLLYDHVPETKHFIGLKDVRQFCVRSLPTLTYEWSPLFFSDAAADHAIRIGSTPTLSQDLQAAVSTELSKTGVLMDGSIKTHADYFSSETSAIFHFDPRRGLLASETTKGQQSWQFLMSMPHRIFKNMCRLSEQGILHRLGVP